MLGLDESALPVLSSVPMRGGLPSAVPTDPTIYRFYEVLQVYGGAIKELIHEAVRRRHHERDQLQHRRRQQKPHPAGDRVVVTLDGKFLSYDWTSAPH